VSFELRDYFETTDGSRPDATPLSKTDGLALPLLAFGVLRGGDVFEGRSSIDGGQQLAARWVEQAVSFPAADGQDAAKSRVCADLVRQLAGNPQLVVRLGRSKPLAIDLVPGRSFAKLGYPKTVSGRASGVFWDHPDWPVARIGLRIDRLNEEPALVFHEMAHAIHYLAFTEEERGALYDLLRPSFGNRSAMDEVFAIYSERELIEGFTHQDRGAPGVYGFTRRQWSDDHVLTRFVRKLYFPHKRLAGPQMAPVEGGGWMKGIAH